MAYRDEVLADSPYLYWRLNETSGTNANDSTANNRDGTYTGTFTLNQSGAVTGGAAVDLDGSSGRINSGVAPFLNTNSWTYEGFTWRDTNTSIDVLFGGAQSTGPRLHIASGSNDVLWDPDIGTAGGEVTWTNAWPGMGQFVHWALKFDPVGDTAALYINGALVSSQACTQNFNTSPGVLNVGASGNPPANFADGKFAEFAVYAAPLSDARILAHYNARFEPVTGTAASVLGALAQSLLASLPVSTPTVVVRPPTWAWVLADSSGSALAELTTASGRAITYRRNTYAEAVCSLSHEDEAATLLWNALRQTGVPTLRCYRDGTLRFNGYLAPFSEQAEEAALLSLVFRSPFARLLGDGNERGRYTAASVIYTNTDAGAIATGLLTTTNTDGATGLAVGSVEATKTRDRQYQFANVGQAIQNLTRVLDGFDFKEEFVEGGATLAEFDVYTELGSERLASRFEYGPATLNNVRAMSRTVQPPINRARVLGANGLYSQQTDAASIAKYGLWPVQVAASDVTEQLTLDDKALALLRPDPIRTVTFSPEFGADNCPLPFDDFDIGDTVPFYARRGALTESVNVRVNGFRVVIDEDGSESAEIEDPSAFDSEATIPAEMSVEVVGG